jgi:WD40 repeat protein
MPKQFWTYKSNGTYHIGLTGGMLWVYDNAENEITRIKTTNYTYDLQFSPDGKRFVTRSNEGILAIYDLETFSLIKKFRYGKAADPHDQNFAFSKDGKLLYIIVYTFDKKIDGPNLWIDVYEMENFTLVKSLFKGVEDFCPDTIEREENTDNFYVLGKKFLSRNPDDLDWQHSIVKLSNDEIESDYPLSDKKRHKYHWWKWWEESGFTEPRRALMGREYQNLSKLNNPLADLWKKCQSKK